MVQIFRNDKYSSRLCTGKKIIRIKETRQKSQLLFDKCFEYRINIQIQALS